MHEPFLDPEGLSCLVCLEAIDRRAAIWSCGTCYESLHLACAQRWAAQRPGTAGPLSKEHFPLAHATWPCPKCRAPHAAAPNTYWCYCGRTDLSRDPPDDHFAAPHSCGELCDKLLLNCQHRCSLSCHAGPCPACTLQLMAPCWCGRAKPRMVRCGKAGYSCGVACARPLPCGHACSLACHAGPCPACPLETVRGCACGALAPKQLPCSAGPVVCNTPCGRALSCGVHTCPRGCHAPPCAPCELEGRRTCPCGRTLYALRCDVELPKCHNACNKLMACGHKCTALCHEGACECRLAVTKNCRCGATKKSGQACGAELHCQTRCPRNRQCGNHQCRRKCCDGQCPPCGEVCGGHLSCGNHKCEAGCHVGPCQPCPKKVTVSCACGLTSMRVACGQESLVTPPRCRYRCSYQVCHHAPAHACHFGPCPPCTQVCDKPAPECGHACPRPCHDPHYPLEPAVPVFKGGELFKTRKQANAEAAIVASAGPRVRRALADVVCEPCPVPVSRACVGKHASFTKMCSSNPVFACAVLCGAALACTHHTCELGCHDRTASACRQCERRCEYRFRSCDHQCVLGCHPDTTAHPPCVVPFAVRCFCGGHTSSLRCFERANVPLVERAKHCGARCPRMRPCGVHRCAKMCHDFEGADPCETACPKLVAVTCVCRTRKGERLPCDDVLRLRRERALARDSPAVLECNAACDAARDEARRKAQAEENAAPAPLTGTGAPKQRRASHKQPHNKPEAMSASHAKDDISIEVYLVSAAALLVAAFAVWIWATSHVTV